MRTTIGGANRTGLTAHPRRPLGPEAPRTP